MAFDTNASSSSLSLAQGTAHGQHDWRLSVRHVARVLLLVSSVAAIWVGFFGVLAFNEQGQSQGDYAFLIPVVSCLLAASALIAAQIRPKASRVLAALAGLVFVAALVATLVAGNAFPLLRGEWFGFALIGVMLVGIGVLSILVVGDLSRLTLRDWPDRGSVLLTVLATFFSVAGAYWMIERESRQNQRLVDVRVTEIAQALQDSLQESIAGFTRMAERWGSLDHKPSLSYMDLEFLTYLRDMPQASTIAAYDDGLEVVHARPVSSPGYEDIRHLLSQAEPVALMKDIRIQGRVELLSPHLSPEPTRVGFVAAGWGQHHLWGGIVLTTLDIDKLVERAFHLRQIPCCLEIQGNGITVFSKQSAGSGESAYVGTDSFHLAGHDYDIRYWLSSGDSLNMNNPVALIFLGLGLLFTFFVNNSQRLAHIANARAREVQYRALHDILTELPNRQMLEQYLDTYRLDQNASTKSVALLLLSVEGLRLVNDSIGHAVGDGVLRVTAQRISTLLPDAALVARTDGGHFAVCVSGFNSAELDALAAHLVRVVSEPVKVDSHLLRISSVVGIAVNQHDEVTSDTLLRQADMAMLQARAIGRDSWCYYTADLGETISSRMSLSSDLQNSIEQKQLELYYQPVVNGWTGAIVGYEALMRWHHPIHGYVAPDRFIPMAEESGQIVELTQWALECAAKAATDMNQNRTPGVYVAVNISTLVFHRADFVQRVRDVLMDNVLPASWLEIEITESMLLDDSVGTVTKLRELGDIGVRIALDDFGTGYSSLNYLKHLPIHKIKLDRSFVNDIVDDPADAEIARAVLAVADLLKLTVIVEGVETLRQFTFLKRMHFEQFQGYLFARPLPLSEALARLRQVNGFIELPDAYQSTQARSVLLVGAESVSHDALDKLFQQTHFRVLRANSISDVMTALALSPIDVLICVQSSFDAGTRSALTELFVRVRHLHPETRRVLIANASVRESLVDALNEGDIQRMVALPLAAEKIMELIRKDLCA